MVDSCRCFTALTLADALASLDSIAEGRLVAGLGTGMMCPGGTLTSHQERTTVEALLHSVEGRMSAGIEPLDTRG